MFKILFHCLTLAGQIISIPIHIIYDIIGADPQHCREPSPYSLSTQCDFVQINEASFSHLDHQSLGFRQYDISCIYKLPVNLRSGILFSSGYTLTNIQWRAAEPLKQETQGALGFYTFQNTPDLHYCSLSLGAYARMFTKWDWSAVFSALIDPYSPSLDYGFYRGLLVSRYQTSQELSLTLGIMQELGLHHKKTWPVVGLIYKPTDKITLDCIYPLNFSLQYQCTDVCDLGVAYRITRFIKKLPQSDLPSSQGILEYQGRAIEGSIKIIPCSGNFIKAFGGVSLGRTISLANKHNCDKQTYHFRCSSFFGGSVVFAF